MPTFLVVDDSNYIRMSCVRLLKEYGHETVEAGNGLEALEVYQRVMPDAILMDITMPKMDGLEALRRILAINPKARVAMVTAVGQELVVTEALKAGARDFIVKPYERTRLLEAVDRLLGGR
jgi:two-component system, chemotaxis family, chemotaxis protein CheY